MLIKSVVSSSSCKMDIALLRLICQYYEKGFENVRS